MTSTAFSVFSNLHQNTTPLILTNIWDAAGATLLSQYGASAIATSSASLAWSSGYADGSFLPNEDLLINVKRIKRVTDLPITIDIEDGYSRAPEEVAHLVSTLVEAGIAGINIEDGTQPPELLTEKISAIRKAVGSELFINARTDVYLQSLVQQDQMLEESVSRSRQYKDAGANGVFIPGTLDITLFETVSQQVDIPLNAMIPSKDYDISLLVNAGVRRFSMGPAPFLTSYSSLIGQNTTLSFDELNGLFN